MVKRNKQLIRRDRESSKSLERASAPEMAEMLGCVSCINSSWKWLPGGPTEQGFRGKGLFSNERLLRKGGWQHTVSIGASLMAQSIILTYLEKEGTERLECAV